MTDYQKYSLCLNGFMAIVVFAGLAFTAYQVYSHKESNKQSHRWNKRKATFEFLNDITSGKFAIIRSELKQLIKLDLNGKSNYDLEISGMTPEYIGKVNDALIQILNYLDAMAIAIKNDILGKKICYDYSSLIFKAYYYWSKPFIDKDRNDLDDRTIYMDFEKLAKAWSHKLEVEKNLGDPYIKGEIPLI